jgi:hypothetical protein
MFAVREGTMLRRKAPRRLVIVVICSVCRVEFWRKRPAAPQAAAVCIERAGSKSGGAYASPVLLIGDIANIVLHRVFFRCRGRCGFVIRVNAGQRHTVEGVFVKVGSIGIVRVRKFEGTSGLLARGEIASRVKSTAYGTRSVWNMQALRRVGRGAAKAVPACDRTDLARTIRLWGLTTLSCIPTSPANLFELDVTIDTTSFTTTASTFERSDDYTSSFSWGNAREARDGSGQVAHNVTNSQRSVLKEDIWQVVLCEETRSDGSCSVKPGKVATASLESKATLRLILSLGMFDSVQEVYIRVNRARLGRWWAIGLMHLVCLRRKRRRDGVWGSRQSCLVVLGIRNWSSSYSSEAVSARTEAVVSALLLDILLHTS